MSSSFAQVCLVLHRFLGAVANPEGIVACVSDSFHILEAMDKWGALKHKIETRKGRLVVRPDSGDPARTDLAVIEKLGSIFGYTVNAKGVQGSPRLHSSDSGRWSFEG